jgi:hypothetical protein
VIDLQVHGKSKAGLGISTQNKQRHSTHSGWVGAGRSV